jgi:hypothetical protein
MNVTGTGSIGGVQVPLNQREIGELIAIANGLKIDIKGLETASAIAVAIQKSGKWNPVVESKGNVTNKGGKRVHKQLGEYKRVRVNPVVGWLQNTSVFVSINAYTVEFQPNEIVELPFEVIKFLKRECKYAKHVWNPHAISENGNQGAHETKMLPKYQIELITDEVLALEAEEDTEESDDDFLARFNSGEETETSTEE